MAEKIDAEALQFGQMLQRYRESAKVTQQETADATGLTKNYISSIERGVHKCNAQTFIAYAKKYGEGRGGTSWPESFAAGEAACRKGSH